jgi:putative acetyltransferase
MFFKEYHIRIAGNSDIPSIKKIISACLTEFGLLFNETGKDEDLNDIEKNYLSGNGFFGVAVQTETNQIVGTFGLFPFSQDICELRKMYLIKEIRGKGVGQYILQSAIQIAREKQYHRIFLETISPLTTAISLYKKFGFTEIAPKEINERTDQAFELYL